MTKAQIIRVIGYTNSNLVARTYEAGLVVKFEDFSGTVMMYETPTGDCRLITCKGSYILKPVPSQGNRFTGIVGDGIKCQFLKEEIAGQLIYWS
jgi:hypothetical protein